MEFVDASSHVEPMHLRLSLAGVSGSGKTYSALEVARLLVEGQEGPAGEVAGIDSENKSMLRYAHPRGPFRFRYLPLTEPKLVNYTKAIELAARNRFGAIVVDSMSHAWDSMLNMVGNSGKRGWGDVRPHERAFWDALLNYPGHVIACFRVKSEYLESEDDRGRTKVTKVGLKAVQRENTEYEFDIALRLDRMGESVTVEKTRCSDLATDKPMSYLGKEFVDKIRPWLDARTDTPAPKPAPKGSKPAGSYGTNVLNWTARAAQLLATCPGAWHEQVRADIDKTGGEDADLRAVCDRIIKSLRDNRIAVPPPDAASLAPPPKPESYTKAPDPAPTPPATPPADAPAPSGCTAS